MTQDVEKDQGFRFTGRMFLAVMIGMFGIIIAVNLVMATMAIRTFPGLEEKNGWVASQSFNRRLAAQKALGWQVTADLTRERIVLDIRDRTGRPAAVQSLTVTIGRATERSEDVTPPLVRRADGAFEAPLALGPGLWELRIRARAADGTEFFQRRQTVLPGKATRG